MKYPLTPCFYEEMMRLGETKKGVIRYILCKHYDIELKYKIAADLEKILDEKLTSEATLRDKTGGGMMDKTAITVTRCRFCKHNLMENHGCLPSKFSTRTGVEFDPIKYGNERRWWHNSYCCPDCGAGIGEFHHPQCDIEECPVCRKPLRTCNCMAMRFYEVV